MDSQSGYFYFLALSVVIKLSEYKSRQATRQAQGLPGLEPLLISMAAVSSKDKFTFSRQR